MQAKTHLNPGYLISGYKEWGGGEGEGGGVPKNSDEERVFMFFWSYPSNPILPPPLLNNKMNRILLGYRSSERALDHEKFRAIKKKLQSKRVIAFLQAKIHLNPGYLISGYKECGGKVASQKNSDEERVFIFYWNYPSNPFEQLGPGLFLGPDLLHHITTSNWTQWYITLACIAFHFCH